MTGLANAFESHESKEDFNQLSSRKKFALFCFVSHSKLNATSFIISTDLSYFTVFNINLI
jgi:hypothetical protein